MCLLATWRPPTPSAQRLGQIARLTGTGRGQVGLKASIPDRLVLRLVAMAFRDVETLSDGLVLVELCSISECKGVLQVGQKPENFGTAYKLCLLQPRNASAVDL